MIIFAQLKYFTFIFTQFFITITDLSGNLTNYYPNVERMMYFCNRKYNKTIIMYLYKHQLSATILLVVTLLSLFGCKGKQHRTVLFDQVSYPYATYYNGNYYYTMQVYDHDKVVLWKTDDLQNISKAKSRTVFPINDKIKSKVHNIWSPEIHRIGNKWYIYFEYDDGNTDDHQLYVLENDSEDPMKGEFQLHGPIITNKDWNWGIHPSTIVVKGQQYLVWSGWQHRRSDVEVQCIFIAKMKNPWTLASQRVKISQPDYEWERQWISSNGSSTSYPIYVNENPEIMFSNDGKNVIIYYSASGCWTTYSALGMLTAPVGSNLLNPRSWKKSSEPVFSSIPEDSIFSPSDICIVNGKKGSEPQLLYETKYFVNGDMRKDIRLKSINYDKNGFPVFGKPL